MPRQVFKFQRPVVTTDPKEPVLIYNKDQSIISEVPMNPSLRRLFGDSYKFYAESDYIPPQGLSNLKIVKPQRW